MDPPLTLSHFKIGCDVTASAGLMRVCAVSVRGENMGGDQTAGVQMQRCTMM